MLYYIPGVYQGFTIYQGYIPYVPGIYIHSQNSIDIVSSYMGWSANTHTKVYTVHTLSLTG